MYAQVYKICYCFSYPQTPMPPRPTAAARYSALLIKVFVMSTMKSAHAICPRTSPN